MAVLKSMPSTSVIKALAGSIDFYESNGQTIARRWPRKAAPGPGTASWCTASLFGALVRDIVSWGIAARQAYIDQASGQPQTINDIAVSLAFGHATKKMYSDDSGQRRYLPPPLPPIPYCSLSYPDLTGTFWAIQDIWCVGYDSGGRVAFTPSSPGDYRVIDGAVPPVYHQLYKTVRGARVPCGWELSYWYPVQALLETFAFPDGHHEFWSRSYPESQDFSGGYNWHTICRVANNLDQPTVSIGPTICTYSKHAIFFDVANNTPRLVTTTAAHPGSETRLDPHSGWPLTTFPQQFAPRPPP